LTLDPFLQQLLTLPEVEHVRLSPDGRWVAFVWYRRHENYDVFLAPCDASAPPLALTHTPEVTWLVNWTPDSQAVIVAEDHEGDERSRLFRVDIDRPGVMIPLTEGNPAYFIRGGSLHPDGYRLFYGANYDFNLSHPIEATWVYRHDLRTGIRQPIACPRKPANLQVELNSQGTYLLYTCKDRHPAGRQVHLVDSEGLQDREILNFGEQVKSFARWLPDGKNILVISESTCEKWQGYTSLGIYHWPTGDLHWLVHDPKRDIEGAWVSPDGAIIVDEVRQAGHVASWIDPQNGTETPFPLVPGNLLPLGRAADGNWVALYYSSTSPAEVVRFAEAARSPQEFTSLTRVWEVTGLRRQHLTPAESITWTAPDGLPVQGWLYRATPNLRRAVLHLHGGPSSHAEDRLNPEIQYLVSRGFHVLDVNYRGSTGFGLPFREAIKEDGWGGREQGDIASGAETLVRMGLAVPGKVGVTGTSYGGYSAWCQITRYPSENIAAAVPICGMTDLRVDFETTRPDLRPYSEEMIGGSPSEIPEKYADRSPVNFIQNIRGKLLIVQGARDPNVTPENVRLVRQRLDQQKIPYELLVFEDEGHGISRPANEAILYPRMADFFESME
jgi:dipeptidyl aminopeptidase/acylaminoacyl peptidase